MPLPRPGCERCTGVPNGLRVLPLEVVAHLHQSTHRDILLQRCPACGQYFVLEDDEVVCFDADDYFLAACAPISPEEADALRADWRLAAELIRSRSGFVSLVNDPYIWLDHEPPAPPAAG